MPHSSAQLLVSVQDADEAETAARTGIDILDIKDPNAGPLAAADPQIWHQIAEVVAELGAPSQPLLSVALGESDQALRIANRIPPGFRFAKMGISNQPTIADLQGTWRELRSVVPSTITMVAVSYADHHLADCPPVEDVMAAASAEGFKHLLVDTFAKRGNSSLDELGWARIQEILSVAKNLGLWIAIAGSINRSMAKRLLDYEQSPDCIGVRGDVCGAGNRKDKLDADRLSAWLALDGFR